MVSITHINWLTSSKSKTHRVLKVNRGDYKNVNTRNIQHSFQKYSGFMLEDHINV